MSKLKEKYPRLTNNKKTSLLRILTKKIIVNPDEEIIDQELNSPFEYLKGILDIYSKNGSSWVQYHPHENRLMNLSGEFFFWIF
jgi:hypothetical protein